MTTNADRPAVLVTGARAPVALEWARLLYAGGFQVYMCDSLPHYVSRHSRCISRAIVVPSPRYETEAFIDAVVEAIGTYGISWVIPTCEEIFYLAGHRNKLAEAGAELFADELPVLLRLHNKLSFIFTAADHGFRVPETRLVESQQELEEVIEDWSDLPRFVLKPVYSRFASRVQIIEPRGGSGSMEIPTDISQDNPWVLQQYIEGTPVCTYSIARDGRILAHSAYESRYRVGLGATVHFAPLDHPASLRWVEQFVKAERFTGQIAFDFIVEPDGTPMPIECNPRATSGIHLFGTEDQIAEMTLRPLVAGYVSGGDSAVVYPRSGKESMLSFAMATYWLRSGLTWTERRRALQAMARSRDVVFRMNDPFPFLGQGAALWALLRNKRKYGVPLLEASTIDLEWNGEER